QPPAAVAERILRVRLDRRRDVRGQRPGRRRPDHQRLAVTALQREAHVQRRVLELDVVLLARLLVLRERSSAARTPLSRAVAFVEPAAAVRLGEEAPDVLDVRVGEREVVVAPVHPLAESLRLLDHHADEAGDALLAARGELCEPVFLDLALRVEPELLLDLDLDPEPLAVEAVLVALVEAAERLVALEDVLEHAPEVLDACRAVRRDRAVHEAERRTAAVAVAQPEESSFLLPQCEGLVLQARMVRHRRQRRETSPETHAFDSREREQSIFRPRLGQGNSTKGTRSKWQSTSPRRPSKRKCSRAPRKPPSSSTSGPSGVVPATPFRRCSRRSPTSARAS